MGKIVATNGHLPDRQRAVLIGRQRALSWPHTGSFSWPSTALIEQRFRDPKFAAPQLSAELHVSRRQMYRHFSAAGESLADLIAKRRLEEVRSVLRAQPGKRLDEVARAAGFASTSAMRNRFRGAYGITPAEFRSARIDDAGTNGVLSARACFGDVEDLDSLDSGPDHPRDHTVQSGE